MSRMSDSVDSDSSSMQTSRVGSDEKETKFSTASSLFAKKFKRYKKAAGIVGIEPAVEESAAEEPSPVTLDADGKVYSYASVHQVDADRYLLVVEDEQKAKVDTAGDDYLRGKRKQFSNGGEAIAKRVVWVERVVSPETKLYQHPDEAKPSPKIVFRLCTKDALDRPLPRYIMRRESVYKDSSKKRQKYINHVKGRQRFFHDSPDEPLYFYQSSAEKIEKKGFKTRVKFYTYMPDWGEDAVIFLNRLEREWPSNPSEIRAKIIEGLELSLSILKAIKRYHDEKKHVHWDLKLENILIQRTGDPSNPFKVTIIDNVHAVPLPDSDSKTKAYIPQIATFHTNKKARKITAYRSAPEVCKAWYYKQPLVPDKNQDAFSAGHIIYSIFEKRYGLGKWFATGGRDLSHWPKEILLSNSFKEFFKTIYTMHYPDLRPTNRPTLETAILQNECLLYCVKNNFNPLDDLKAHLTEEKETKQEVITTGITEKIKQFLRLPVHSMVHDESELTEKKQERKYAVLPVPSAAEDPISIVGDEAVTILAENLADLLSRCKELKDECELIERAQCASTYRRWCHYASLFRQGVLSGMPEQQLALKKEKIEGLEYLINEILIQLHLQTLKPEIQIDIKAMIQEAQKSHPRLTEGKSSRTNRELDKLCSCYHPPTVEYQSFLKGIL